MQTRIQRALLSVSDKSGLVELARGLRELGVELISSGGTFAALRAAGVEVREVSDYTGFPEILSGRVKTLHPKVHGGILALREEGSHRSAMAEHGIQAIDLVVVNLYPFESTVESAAGDARRAFEEAIEQIDIGGPAMLRAAAKNHRYVGVVSDPGDYGRVLEEMRKGGVLSDELRAELARKAFALTARYDSAISRWLLRQDSPPSSDKSPFPPSFAHAGVKACDLRYGENPHQRAAVYRDRASRGPSVIGAKMLSGKELSCNNLVDLDAALALAAEFDEPFVAVIKHNNPCGAARGGSILEALEGAWSGDPLSAFGSVLALTREVDLACAEFLVAENRFVEAIIAPSYAQEALQCLTGRPRWGKSVRLLASGPFGPLTRDKRAFEIKPLQGGFLLQEPDFAREEADLLKIVTRAAPTERQMQELCFAAIVAKHVKSNAIVISSGGRTLGVGAGQMSRVDAVHLAVRKAGASTAGSVLASDAFFPFPDGVEMAIEAGVSAILQPGGSVRDEAVIAACNARGVPMVFSGVRHFRH